MECVWLEFLSMPSLRRASGCNQHWQLEAMHIVRDRRRKAACIIQRAARCALAKITLARLRCERLVYFLHAPDDAEQRDMHPRYFWMAYWACVLCNDPEKIQWIVDRLNVMGQPMVGMLAGRGVLAALHFVRQLNREQLLWFGFNLG